MADSMAPADNKFHQGNGSDGKHYWLTPPDVYRVLDAQHAFTFDPCPYPKPPEFDGLTCEWGSSNYVNPPFGSIVHEGKKKGPTAWARKAIAEAQKGKRVVLVYPLDKWVLMLLAAGAKVSNLGDVRWLATEDGSQGKGTGRHIACFVLDGLARSEQGWRPIETAPCDDTPALVWFEYGRCCPGVQIVDLDHDSDPAWWAERGATHWMPLPDRPEALDPHLPPSRDLGEIA